MLRDVKNMTSLAEVNILQIKMIVRQVTNGLYQHNQQHILSKCIFSLFLDSFKHS